MVLLVDPLLVHSVGWWLSVGATAGIALAGPPLALRLPGPQAVRTALAVTIGAQLGVAPVSIAVFGPLPLASVPANLMAAPLAGPVMIYGLPAGLVAAGAPDGLARLIQLPTVLLVRAIAGIASSACVMAAARLGLPGGAGGGTRGGTAPPPASSAPAVGSPACGWRWANAPSTSPTERW